MDGIVARAASGRDSSWTRERCGGANSAGRRQCGQRAVGDPGIARPASVDPRGREDQADPQELPRGHAGILAARGESPAGIRPAIHPAGCVRGAPRPDAEGCTTLRMALARGGSA